MLNRLIDIRKIENALRTENFLISSYLFLKRSIIYYIATSQVYKNQKEIINYSKKSKKIILIPQPPLHGGGSVEHYYHFMFDLVLPLYYLYRKLEENITILIPDRGIYTPRVKELFGNRIQLFSENHQDGTRVSLPLVGMNPHVVNVDRDIIDEFVDWCSHKIVKEKNKMKNKCIFIRRGNPDPYFLSEDCTYPEAGAMRRSIINHEELVGFLKSRISRKLDFHEVVLEQIPFKEQIELFQQARVIIGQHGAGLLNCIWCDPKTIVIEINNQPKKNHFKIISDSRGLNHSTFIIENAHEVIDPKKFMDFLEEKSTKIFDSLQSNHTDS